MYNITYHIISHIISYHISYHITFCLILSCQTVSYTMRNLAYTLISISSNCTFIHNNVLGWISPWSPPNRFHVLWSSYEYVLLILSSSLCSPSSPQSPSSLSSSLYIHCLPIQLPWDNYRLSHSDGKPYGDLDPRFLDDINRNENPYKDLNVTLGTSHCNNWKRSFVTSPLDL